MATTEAPTVCDCGHPPTHKLGHAYNPPPGTVDVQAHPSTWLCECGETYSAHGIGTGYARQRATGRTLCYPCAEDAERADFAAAEPGARWFAYLTDDDRKVTTWTGATLARVVRRWETGEGFGGRTVRIWAVDPSGRWWSGRGPVDSGTYVRLRLLKREPR